MVDTSSPRSPTRVPTLTRSKAKVAISPQKKADGGGKQQILHPPDPTSLVPFPLGSSVYGESQSPLSPPCCRQGKDKIDLSTAGDSLPSPAPLMPSRKGKGKKQPLTSPRATKESLLTPMSASTALHLPLSPSSTPRPIWAGYRAKLDARLARMWLPPSGDMMQHSLLFGPDALDVSPMSERDFLPLGGRDSPVSARQLNPKGQESYSNCNPVCSFWF